MKRIGILMMLPPGAHPTYSYIRTSVLRWFAIPGIEIVPIPATLTSAATIAAYFQYINGLFLHPDWADHPNYARMVQTLLAMATEANRRGDYFPVWGTCLGFESMMQIAGTLGPLERFDARQMEKARSRLHLRDPEIQRSRLFSAATNKQLAHLRHKYMPYLDHDYGVSVGRFESNKILRSMFRVLSTCHDRAGKEYVSMIEGRSLPFYGTQFHPDMDRDLGWMVRFFLREMQKSHHDGFRPYVELRLDPASCLEEMKYRVPCMRMPIQ